MPACEASFQELKKRLTTVPVLVMPDSEKPFSIYCDTSGQGLGCVLMQDGRVVVTPTFFKKYNFANIGMHIGCISICRAYEKTSKINLAWDA
jgi:hypothetical protein